jgi:hypothetical protein
MLKDPNIWRRIEDKSIWEPNSGCLLWLGAVDGKKYAALSGPRLIPGKKESVIKVARLILTHKLGRPPLMALHTCDNSYCISEHHIYEGGQSENSRDAIKRGRLMIRRVNGKFAGSSKGRA